MIGEKIKNSRKQMGLTQAELVKKAQNEFSKENYGAEVKIFDQAQLSKWENGEQIPNIKNLCLLSMLLNVSFFDLSSTKNSEFIDNFYQSGYNLAKSIEQDLTTQIHKLLNYIKSEDIRKINQQILELYIYNNKEMPKEIAVMIPICYTEKKESSDYISYIQAFISGLNNGNIKK